MHKNTSIFKPSDWSCFWIYKVDDAKVIESALDQS